MTAGRKQEHSGTLRLSTPPCTATVIDDHQWVDLIHGSNTTDDKLLLVDGITGARVRFGIGRGTHWWKRSNSSLPATATVTTATDMSPAQIAPLTALISEFVGDQPVDSARLAAGLTARGVSVPTRKPQPDDAQPNPRTDSRGGDAEYG